MKITPTSSRARRRTWRRDLAFYLLGFATGVVLLVPVQAPFGFPW